MTTKDIVHSYYDAWAAQDQARVRELLANDVKFVSPQDRFESADGFLGTCWKYSQGLAGVEYLTELYDGNQGFVLLRWKMESGQTFSDAEYIRVADGKVAEILVVNNDPSFEKMLG